MIARAAWLGGVGARCGRILLLCYLAVQSLHAPCADAQADPRIRTVAYSPTQVVDLTGFVGYHVHLEFAVDERFVSLGSGDTAAIDIGSDANHLFLKPRSPTPGTNLTILTNRRVYLLDFRALARTPRPGEAVYSLRFSYPTDESPVQTVSADAEAATPLAGAPPVLNRDYWFCGDASLRPSTTTDDGLQIRMTFPPQFEVPAIYVRSADGAETLVNSHVEGDAIIVHRLADKLVLRRGALVGCVTRRKAGTRGRRAASGTISDSVRRETSERLP